MILDDLKTLTDCNLSNFQTRAKKKNSPKIIPSSDANFVCASSHFNAINKFKYFFWQLVSTGSTIFYYALQWIRIEIESSWVFEIRKSSIELFQLERFQMWCATNETSVCVHVPLKYVRIAFQRGEQKHTNRYFVSCAVRKCYVLASIICF